nr:MAG TPA: hypothetical protein [Caudoviricetes sp.]
MLLRRRLDQPPNLCRIVHLSAPSDIFVILTKILLDIFLPAR